MIEVKCKQGTMKWKIARGGKPTGSEFSRIIAPSTSKMRTGDMPKTYMAELVIERLRGFPEPEGYGSAAIERGNELEPFARDWYRSATGIQVDEVGFIMEDGGRWGCSPDGMSPAVRGTQEIKCYEDKHHVLAWVDDKAPADVNMQAQACMWICDADWCDFILYTDKDGLPSKILRIEPDRILQEVFAEALPKFCDRLDEITEKIKEANYAF